MPGVDACTNVHVVKKASSCALAGGFVKLLVALVGWAPVSACEYVAITLTFLEHRMDSCTADLLMLSVTAAAEYLPHY